MPDENQGFLSRKFLLSLLQLGILVLLPVIYKRLEISDEVLMIVLVSSSSLVGVYTGFNVLQKKIENL